MKLMKILMAMQLIAAITVTVIGCSGDAFHNYKKERDAISIPHTPDTTPPVITNVETVTNNQIRITFDEELDPASVQDYKNYYIQGSNRVNVLSNPAPQLDSNDTNNKSVLLTVSTGLQYGLYHGRQYTLLVQNVSDTKGNRILNATATFIGKGAVVAEVFATINGEEKQLSQSSSYLFIKENALTVTVKVNGNTQDCYYSYSLDNSQFSSETSCDNPLSLNNLSEGIHILRIIGKNESGAVQDINQATEVQFVVDTVAPVATLSKTPESVTTSKEIAILVGGIDVLYYRYRINNESWSNTVSVHTPIMRNNLLDGNYRLEVKGIDQAGNEQITPTVHEWRISSGETISFISKPDRYTRLRSISIVVGGNDIYFYKYSINNQVWSGYISIDEPIVLNNLNDGDYTIRVIGAVIPGDPSTETDEISYTWTVDTVPPQCTLSNVPLDPTNRQRTAILVSSQNNDVVAYRYKLIIGGVEGQISGVYSVSTPLELTALGENTYTIKVMGIDAAGNMQSESSATEYSWEVDLTPPTAVLSNLPEKNTNINNINVAVSSIDDSAIAYRYCLNNSPWSSEIAQTVHIQQSNIDDGIYMLSVVAKDLAGNWQSFQTPTEYVWEIDTTPPTVVLLNKPPSITNLQSADFDIGGVGVVRYTYKLDNGDWSQEYDRIEHPSIILNNLEEGNHTIYVKGVDKAGNWQQEPTEYTWTINTSVPTAVLTNTPPYYTNVSFIDITVSGVVSYKYKLDSQNWSVEKDVQEHIIQDNLSEGYHILTVIGKNAQGQWQEVDSATICEWIIDTVAPTAQIANTPQNPTNNQSIAVRVYGVGVYAYKYSLDNPDPTGSAEILLQADDTINIDNIPGGTHTLYVIARDEAGNWQLVSNATTHTWTIDTSTPVAELVQATLPASITNNTGINISIAGNNVIAYKYKLDNGLWSGEIAITYPITKLGLDEGSHTIYVIGKNEAGSWQAESNATSYSWIVDLTAPEPPEIILGNLPNNPTDQDSINITVSGTGITHYRYKINSESWSDPIPIGTNIERNSLLENTYTLYVIAKDEAGNWTAESNAKTYTWRVDFTSPIAAITNRPDEITNQNWAEFIIAGTGIIQYKYKLNNGTWSEWRDIAERISLSSLADGTYTIYVCGRKSSTSPYFEQPEDDATTYTWEVDTVAPTALLSNLPENPTTDTTANITVSGEQVIAYRYRLNNGAWIPATSEIIKDFPITMSGLAPGNYTIDVIAKDIAGNWQTNPTSYSWTINPPPLVSPVTVDMGDVTTSAALTFSWVRPYGTADVKIQIASDINFNNVVFETIIGNVDYYTYIVESTEIQQYYARVSVNDESGKPLNDPSWKAWGTPSNGITIVGGVYGVIKEATSGFPPLQDVTVEVRRMNDNTLVTSMQTDSNGEFAFNGIPIGSNYYKIVALKSGYFGATKQNITIPLGEQTSVGILYLLSTSASSGTLSGTVIDANDASKLSNVTVSVYDWQNNLITTVTTNINGDFTTSTLNPGVYNVKLTRTGYYDLVVDNVVINGNRNIGRQAICAYLIEPMVRVIVLWGDKPEDLDLHVVGPTAQTVTEEDTNYNNPRNRFHVGYIGEWQYNYNEATGTYSYSNPDRTGTKSTTALVQDVYPGNPITGAGYGPEAINLWRYGGVQYARGVYTYTVRNYSTTDWYEGGINVVLRIYDSNGMVREIIMPAGANDPTNTTRDWKAVKITIQGNSRSQRFIYVPSLLQGVFFNAGWNINKAGFDW